MEETYCLCGCGKKTNGRDRFKKGHAKIYKEKTGPKLCACGCGGYTTWDDYKKCWNDFIEHHQFKNKSEEHLKKIGKTLSKMFEGEGNPFYGRKHTEETKNKIGKINATKPRTKGKDHWSYGKRQSKEVRKRQGEARRGKNNGNWKGGISPLVMTIRSCLKYKEWRLSVYRRDEFTCQKCGRKLSDKFNAHHIKPFHQIFEENNIQTLEGAYACQEFWEINNGITLCKECHTEEHQNREETK